MTIHEQLTYLPRRSAAQRRSTPAAVAPRPRWRGALAAAPKRWLVAGDLIAVGGAQAAAIALRNQSGAGGFSVAPAVIVASITTAVAPAILSSCRLYASRHITRSLDEVRRLVWGTFAILLAMSVLCVALGFGASRAWLALAGALTAAALLVERGLFRRLFRLLRQDGTLSRTVVLVGANSEAQALCSMFSNDRSLGYDVVSVIDAPRTPEGEPLTAAAVQETLAAVERTGANGVVLAATALDLATSNRLIRCLTDAGVHVELSSTLQDIAPNRLTVRSLGRFPVVYVEPVRRSGWRRIAKRAFDVSVAAALLVATAPVLAVAALAVKVDSPGPVLFRQRRVGRDGKSFEVLKLRTMVVDAEARLVDLLAMNEADGPLFKVARDPRVTRVGRLLRKTSIDELPQLWNVLRNEMSLVGPRPALENEVARWSTALHDRLRVQPGITGAWQVNGRSSSSFDDYERLDLYYVDNWSLLTDVAILAKTVPAVLFQRGAC